MFIIQWVKAVVCAVRRLGRQMSVLTRGLSGRLQGEGGAWVLLLKERQWMSRAGRTGEPRASVRGPDWMEYSHKYWQGCTHQRCPDEELGPSQKDASISFRAKWCDRKGATKRTGLWKRERKRCFLRSYSIPVRAWGSEAPLWLVKPTPSLNPIYWL